MTTTLGTRPLREPTRPDVATPDLDIVVPVYNEQRSLAPSIQRLHSYLGRYFPFTVRITIADNASTDGTWQIATRLQEELVGVRAVHLDQKGRGRALHEVWSHSDAAVLCYMDVDLSTDLKALLPLVAPLMSGHSDVAIGTRLRPSSRVVRGPKREIISRCYNFLLRTTLAARFSDAQCGFKAIRADRAKELLPLVEDNGFFFDTELLILAERSGMRIHEVPVDWVDDPDSRVDIKETATADIKGIIRLARGMASGRLDVTSIRSGDAPLDPVERSLVQQLVRFVAVGVVSTAAYVLLFLLLGTFLPSLAANALALAMTAIANTAVNRRLTFGVKGAADRFRHQAQGFAIFLVGLGLTSGSLALLHLTEPNATTTTELAVLVAANIGATMLRFLLFRSWVFPTHSTSATIPTVLEISS